MTKIRSISIWTLAFIFTFVSLPLARASETRIIDVVSITWAGAAQPSTSVEDVRNSITNEASTRWNYLAQNWPGGITFQIGTVISTPLVMSSPLICEGTESSAYMRDVRRAFYTKYPMADYASHYLVFLSPAPRPNCVWEGKSLLGDAAYPGGLVALKNNSSAFVITHELGHTLGLGHTNLMRCSQNASDGDWSNCNAIEYGGAVDVMSNVDVKGDLSTYHQWRMGIIPYSDVKQVWKSQSIDLKYTNSPSGIRAIFIRDGKSTYWVEFRKSSDSTATGLAIYRTDPPPTSSIITPNILDFSDATSKAVTSDVWLLNLDSFKYNSFGTATGSPTLPIGKTFLDANGNISISASQKDVNTLSVQINRKNDVTPPPIPILTNLNTWNSPDSDLLVPGYEDGESVIDKFQISINDKIIDVEGSESSKWIPTYLSPLTATKSLHVKDLPEGTYKLKIRSVDIYGNQSLWTQSIDMVIDRGVPEVLNQFKIVSVASSGTKLAWTGATDSGSGICSIQVSNTDGFVYSRMDRSNFSSDAPELVFKGETSGLAQVFDCRGNGVEGDLKVSANFVPASKAKTTGKVKISNDEVACTLNCTLSFTVSGDIQVRVSKGSGTAFINNVTSGNFKANSEPLILNIGSKRKIVRLSGRDIVIQGLSQISTIWQQKGLIQRKVTTVDATLEDKDQAMLSKFGFRSTDFSQDFIVQPIARGTTLQDATLDVCNGNFPSEKSRIMRRQVAAYKVGSKYSFISTETVKYRSAVGAASALTDLDEAIIKCKQSGGATSVQGAVTKYLFIEPPKFTFTEGIKGRLVLAAIGEGTDQRWLLGFFQIKGEMAVNTYIVRAEKFSDEDLKRWVQVASEISSRLSGYTPVNSAV